MVAGDKFAWVSQHLSWKVPTEKIRKYTLTKCTSYLSDPGKFSGTPESSFYVGAVQNKNEVPANITSCSDLLTGNILNQPEVVATSGNSIWLSEPQETLPKEIFACSHLDSLLKVESRALQLEQA